ncbi:MAG TPA: hypothetical protein VFS62_04275 [Chloroflexota bacterium]|jgi:hypothetical protein|nr:hypothetical protein [Chloroflexota bacterium]
MKGLFWFGAGLALGAFGYRYYTANGGRFPFLEQWTGMTTDEMLDQAGGMMDQAGETAQKTISDTTANVAKQTVAAVAEEIADAESAKRREQSRSRRKSSTTAG